MFTIDEKKNINMTQGDTGHFIVRPVGIEFVAGNTYLGLFTVKSERGELKMQKTYPIEDGMIQVDFANSDTDQWLPGKYRWEMRYFVNPEYDSETNNLISGEEVYTPKRANNTRMLILEEALGNV